MHYYNTVKNEKGNLFWEKLFNTLKNEQISYCVLHSYENLPDNTKSDVDIAVTVSDKDLDRIMQEVCRKAKLKILLKLHYGIPGLVAYDVYDKLSLQKIAQVDFYNDNMGISWLSVRSDYFLKNAVDYKNMSINNGANEFLYLILKRVYKQELTTDQQKKILSVYTDNKTRVENLINDFFGSQNLKMIIDLLYVKEQVNIKKLLKKIKAVYYKKQKLYKPWKIPLSYYYQFIRAFKRFKSPTGLIVAFLSPDGGGKSSVINAVIDNTPAFRNSKYFHWRPGLFPPLNSLRGKDKNGYEVFHNYYRDINTKNRITSAIRWLYYSIDYIAGYYLKILPLKTKTSLIMYDRYYYDILIDPVRYGFNVPLPLIKCILPLIPSPDLTIYLDNEPEVFYKRKQELTLEETQRQVNAWRENITCLPNCSVIVTDKPVNSVTTEVIALIMAKREEMTEKILKINPPASKYLWNTKWNSWVALPSLKKCKLIIPVSHKHYNKSWDLYQPYSFYGKVYKRIMKSGFAFNYVKSISSFSFNGSYFAECLKNKLKEVLDAEDIVMAISEGTPGPYNKKTGMVMDHNGNTIAYVKIAETENSIKRLQHEAVSLKQTEKMNFRNILTPHCIYADKINGHYILVLTPPPFKGKPGANKMNNEYLRILKMMMLQTISTAKLNDTIFYQKMQKAVNNYALTYKDLLYDAIKKNKKYENTDIPAYFCHGDFTPWNMVWYKETVFLYDWESAIPDAPAGFDFIHFVYQTNYLLHNKRGGELLNALLQEKNKNLLQDISGVNLIDYERLVLYYLVYMAADHDILNQMDASAVERRKLIKMMMELT